jgi:hypothetical protein
VCETAIGLSFFRILSAAENQLKKRAFAARSLAEQKGALETNETKS